MAAENGSSLIEIPLTPTQKTTPTEVLLTISTPIPTDIPPTVTATPIPTLIPTPTSVPCVSPPAIKTQAAVDAYRSVLKNEIPYMNTYDQEETYLFPVSTNVVGTASQFAVVDLEQNGTPEIIIKIVLGETNEIGSEILCYQEGVVYGTRMQIRGFNDLKANGEFYASSGISYAGIYRIALDKFEHEIIEVAHFDAVDIIDSGEINYYINSEPVTEDKFNIAMTEYDLTDMPTWYDITELNINTAVH